MPKQHKRRLERTPIQEAIEELARERFAFLLDDKGFVLGAPDRTRYWTTNVYLSTRIGVEVTVEFNRDYSVAVDLIRTQDGQLLPDWETLEVSQRWRKPVIWLLRMVPGVSQTRLGQVMDLYKQLDAENPATYDSLLTVIADQLQESVDYLASQPYEVLFPPSVPRG